MEANPSNYQKKEAGKNKAKAKSEYLFSGKIDAPVEMFEKEKAEDHISEKEMEKAIDMINPDKNSIDSRG